MIDIVAALLVIGFALQDIIKATKRIIPNFDKIMKGVQVGLYFKLAKMTFELVVDVVVIYICVKFILLVQ